MLLIQFSTIHQMAERNSYLLASKYRKKKETCSSSMLPREVVPSQIEHICFRVTSRDLIVVDQELI